MDVALEVLHWGEQMARHGRMKCLGQEEGEGRGIPRLKRKEEEEEDF